MGHVELGLLFLQLAQVVILLIICCTKNGLQTMTKTVPEFLLNSEDIEKNKVTEINIFLLLLLI